MAKLTNHVQWTRLTNTIHLTLKMTPAQVVETSVTNNSSLTELASPIRPTDTPGFKPFTMKILKWLLCLSLYLMWVFPFQIIEKSISKLSQVAKIVANSDETTVDDFLVISDTLDTATANKDVLTLNARVKLIF